MVLPPYGYILFYYKRFPAKRKALFIFFLGVQSLSFRQIAGACGITPWALFGGRSASDVFNEQLAALAWRLGKLGSFAS
jgi:hypothetical protein